MALCLLLTLIHDLQPWINPSKRLVNTALDYWLMNKLRADNCTAVTALLDPPGPPLSGLLAWQKLEAQNRVDAAVASASATDSDDTDMEAEDDSVDSCAGSSSSSASENFSELAALLSAPVVSADVVVPAPILNINPAPSDCRTLTPPKGILVQRTADLSERTDREAARTDDDPEDPAFRVLRNRTLSVSSVDNKCPKKGSALLGSLRKKVVTMETGLAQPLRKRPMTRSFHDSASCEDRNASDTENQVKKSRRSLPVSAVASHRILRSGTVSSLVRTLRSQDSNLRVQGHYRRKRSRSFTPMKRRKQ